MKYKEKGLPADEAGVSLIIVFFIMVIIIALVLSASIFLYHAIRVVRNISNSVVSFYAADSGIEKVLYYDRKVLSSNDTRGMCQMCASSNPSCPSSSADPGLLCTSCALSTTSSNGCNSNVCNDCTISFDTQLGGGVYAVQATVFPNATPYDMEISSTGTFSEVGRAINVLIGEE